MLDFLRWLTVGKKKNSLIEKPLVSLLENLDGWLGLGTEMNADVNTSPGLRPRFPKDELNRHKARFENLAHNPGLEINMQWAAEAWWRWLGQVGGWPGLIMGLAAISFNRAS